MSCCTEGDDGENEHRNGTPAYNDTPPGHARGEDGETDPDGRDACHDQYLGEHILEFGDRGSMGCDVSAHVDPPVVELMTSSVDRAVVIGQCQKSLFSLRTATHDGTMIDRDFDLGTMTVVGVDGSASAHSAVRWAAADAAARKTPMLLVYAGIGKSATSLSSAVNLRAGTTTSARVHAREALATARVIARSAVDDDIDVQIVLESAPPAETLIHYAETARMLVLGSRRHSAVARAVLGSVSSVVAAHARCPIAVIPENYADQSSGPSAGPVVVGLDHSSNDDAVLGAAFDQASRLGAPLYAVHACEKTDPAALFSEYVEYGPHLDPASGPKRWIDRLVATWGEKYAAVDYTTHISTERPSHALLNKARDAQLIVVGARSRRAIPPLVIGSTGRAVLHHVDIPVIVVPAVVGRWS